MLEIYGLRFTVEGAGFHLRTLPRKVDIRLPGKGNSNSRGARPVYSFGCLSGLGPLGCQKDLSLSLTSAATASSADASSSVSEICVVQGLGFRVYS